MWLLYRIPENITSSHGLEFMFLAPVMESRMEQAIGTHVQCSSFKEPITWIQGPCSASGVLRHILESLVVRMALVQWDQIENILQPFPLNKIVPPLQCKRNTGYLAASVGHRRIYWHRAENQYTHIWEGGRGGLPRLNGKNRSEFMTQSSLRSICFDSRERCVYR